MRIQLNPAFGLFRRCPLVQAGAPPSAGGDRPGIIGIARATAPGGRDLARRKGQRWMQQVSDTGPARMLLRGALLRCPRCGSGGLFRGLTTMVERCPRCGLSFEHEEGYWVGAMTINVTVALVVGILAIGAAVAATWPDIPVVPLVVVGVAAMILGPILFHPFSRTLWVALDLVFFNRGASNEGRRRNPWG